MEADQSSSHRRSSDASRWCLTWHQTHFRRRLRHRPGQAHGRYAEAVIELEQVTGTVAALVAASNDAAAAIGLGRSKGVRHGYDADE